MKFTWKQIVEFLIGPQESGVRAKDSKGRFVADDKKTVDVNEAYKGGRKPKSKDYPRTRKKQNNCMHIDCLLEGTII